MTSHGPGKKPTGQKWGDRPSLAAALGVSRDTYNNAVADGQLRMGTGGDPLRSKVLSRDIQELRSDAEQLKGYVYDQGESNSSLVIGPTRFSYSVQDIQLSERKAVYSPKTLRSDRPMLIGSGNSDQIATVSLLFNGLDEINNGLRALVALFKVCPILSISNEMISRAWAPKTIKLAKIAQEKLQTLFARSLDGEGVSLDSASRIYSDISKKIRENQLTAAYVQQQIKTYNVTEKEKEILNSLADEVSYYRNSSKFVPVAMENISVQTVPDLPETLMCTLSLHRIEVDSVTDNGIIEWLNYSGGPTPNPKNAFWLKKYLRYFLLNKDGPFLPVVESQDFGRSELRFWTKTISNVQPIAGTPSPIVFNLPEHASKLEGQSASMTNYFSFHKLINKGTPCAHHMGTSARALSLDLSFSDEDDIYDRLNQFKELTDDVVRRESIKDRLMGIEALNICTLILGGSGADLQETRYGVYASLATDISTDRGVPGLKNCSITLSETNTNLHESYEILLKDNDNDIDDQKQFFLGKNGIGICPGEKAYRSKGVKDQQTSLVTGNYDYRAYSVYWPVGVGAHLTNVDAGLDGIVNRDTFMAALFSPSFDTNSDLRNKAMLIPIFTGIIRSKEDISSSFITSAKIGWDKILTFKLSVTNPELAEVSEVLSRYVDKMFEGNSVLSSAPFNSAAKDTGSPESYRSRVTKFIENSNEEQRFRIDLVEKIIHSLARQPLGIGELLRQLAADKDHTFSRDFKYAIFYAITKRPKKPNGLATAWRQDGLLAGYTSFYLEYKLNKDRYPGFGSNNEKPDQNTTRKSRRSWRSTTYRDFAFLPTYRDLFGNIWQMFAPTYDDLGIHYFQGRGPSKITDDKTLDQLQQGIAVYADDKVPPYVWFYATKEKPRMRQILHSATKQSEENSFLGSLNKLYLSLNIASTGEMARYTKLSKQVKDLERIATMSPEELRKRFSDGEEAVVSLVEMISRGYHRRTDLVQDLESIDSLVQLVSSKDDDKSPKTTGGKNSVHYKFYRTFLEKDANGNPLSPYHLNIYFSSVGKTGGVTGFLSTNTSPSPLLGAALISVMRTLRREIMVNGKFGDISPVHDELQATPGGPELGDSSGKFLRHSRDNTITSTRSSLAQVPDNKKSLERLWPAVKVYFIDFRGNDIVAEDVFFSSDAILSVDVTLDKDDAALCVIKVADPLRYLANSTFLDKFKISTDDGSVVAGNKRGASKTLQSGKIEQGRPIQVRMGYGSVAENLETVFTGRITEINLGDIVTIVAQGWKAELINRHVNFYTTKQKNWGPKDLSVLALQLADPQGLGEHIPESDARKLIDAIGDNKNYEDIVNRVHQVQAGTQKVKGVDAFFRMIKSDFWSDFYGIDDDKKFEGIDTRLKNIWYPDTGENISNFMAWRSILNVHPEFVSDGWLVPLQPCWNVLKEAARHTWNYIVQVVPYDAEATLFFGHPDQMYYFTRGEKIRGEQWQKYASAVHTDGMQTIFDELISGFLASPYYSVNRTWDYRFTKQLINAVWQGDFLTYAAWEEANYTLGLFKDLKSVKWHPLEDLCHVLPTSKTQVTNQPTLTTSRYLPTDPRFLSKSTLVASLADSVVYKNAVLASSKPLDAYRYLVSVFGANDILAIIYSFLFGFDLQKIKLIGWNYKRDTIELLGSQRKDNHSTIYIDSISNSTLVADAIPGIYKTQGAAVDAIDESIQALSQIVGLILSKDGPTQTSKFTRTVNTVPYNPAQALLLNPEPWTTDYSVNTITSLVDKADVLSAWLDNNRQDERIKELLVALDKQSKMLSLAGGTGFSGEIVIEGSKENVLETKTADKSAHNRRVLSIANSLISQLRSFRRVRQSRSALQDIIIKSGKTQSGAPIQLPICKLSANMTIGEMLNTYGAKIKSFIYFLAEYVKNTSGISSKVKIAAGNITGSLASPNLRTFRVHHHITSDRDIISNDIAASTSQMWNTVVINHPAGDPDDAVALDNADEAKFNRGAMLNSSVSWRYWPPTAISKVIGLQFHPGITLANKKLRTFTEVNCHNEPLAAKIACNHLAQGIRHMYVGTLAIRGRVIKPYDVIILDDRYTGMEGPCEVESIVHHFSPEVGWITNVKPAALCEANPGAAVIQTALMERSYRLQSETIDSIFTAINVGLLVFTGGLGGSIGGTLLKGGSAATKNLVRTVAGTSLGKGAKANFSALWRRIAIGYKRQLGVRGRNLGRGSPMAAFNYYVRSLGLNKVAVRLLTSLSAEAIAKAFTQHTANYYTTTSWVDGAKEARQLPIILSPLIYNGAPYTAGLEADEIMFTVPFYDTYASLHDIATAWSDYSENVLFSPFGDK